MAARYLTTSQAAKALSIGRATLNRWALDGLVTPAFTTPGGQRRWDLADLRQQLGIAPDPGDAK